MRINYPENPERDIKDLVESNFEPGNISIDTDKAGIHFSGQWPSENFDGLRVTFIGAGDETSDSYDAWRGDGSGPVDEMDSVVEVTVHIVRSSYDENVVIETVRREIIYEVRGVIMDNFTAPNFNVIEDFEVSEISFTMDEEREPPIWQATFDVFGNWLSYVQ